MLLLMIKATMMMKFADDDAVVERSNGAVMIRYFELRRRIQVVELRFCFQRILKGLQELKC